MKLVWCAGGNKGYMQIARDTGWHTGARSDAHIYGVARPLYLLDCHWTTYNWPRHLAVTMRERPALVAVPDILTPAGVPLALAQAAALAPYCAALLIIPKCRVIGQIPRSIGGVPVVLGYSVPSRYGASPLPLWEYAGWPVHLLGGTPLRQLEIASYLCPVSADGNVAQRVARLGGVITDRGGRAMLRAYEPETVANIPSAALRHSLVNIAALWQRAGYTVERSEPSAERVS